MQYCLLAFAIFCLVLLIAKLIQGGEKTYCAICNVVCEATYPEAPYNDDLIVYKCPKCGLEVKDAY